MKLSLFLTPLMLLFLTGCNPENESPGSGDVSFSLELLTDTQGGREMQSLPPGSYLQISIETAAGEETLTNHQLPILTFAGAFASQPLELPEGDYVLTEFLVISAENEVLYATPIAGSPLADLVDEPLPIAFTVTAGAGTQVRLQVINVAMLTPEDVGYVTFPFAIVSHFFLTVFEGGQALTDAAGYIVQGDDTLKTFSILPEINTVSFVGDNAGEFTLVIIKSGYGKYSESFTIQGIVDDYSNSIVPVTLAPALTFVAVGFDYGSSYPYSFDFDVDFEGNLTIDWGDGTIEDVVDGDDIYHHEFEHQRDYFVSVTGDIDNIVSFYSYYGGGPMNAIDVTNLPELMDFRNGYNGSSPSPSVIDLSQNPKLVYVDVSISESLEELILPENGNISGLVMQAPNGLTPADLEGIITTLYNAAVASMRYDGYIDLQSPVDGAVTGPPTEATLDMLRSLRDTYNWNITPDPE